MKYSSINTIETQVTIEDSIKKIPHSSQKFITLSRSQVSYINLLSANEQIYEAQS